MRTDNASLSRRIADLSTEKRAYLEQLLRTRGLPTAGPTIVARDWAMPAPLSSAQQRLWFLDRLEPENPFYTISTALKLPTPLHIEALECALNEIVQRHEILRTTFAMVDEQPVQVIAPAL